MESKSGYFARRASEEREAALKSAHATAREAHLTLAKRYDELANASEVIDEAAISPR
jgi:hypothetical protein